MSQDLFDELKQFTGADLDKDTPSLPKTATHQVQQVHETIKQVEQTVQQAKASGKLQVILDDKYLEDFEADLVMRQKQYKE